MVDTEAYKLQVLDDHDGRRLRIDGSHVLNMFRPESRASAPAILEGGHICWVRPEDVGAVAEALGLERDGSHYERVSSQGVPLPAMSGSESGAA